MENRTIKFAKAGALFIVIIFVVSSATAMTSSPQERPLFLTKKTATLFSPSRDEIELKYYDPETLCYAVRIQTSELVIWKSAIRLTQAEMAPYMDFWTLTKVNVAFTKDEEWTSIDIRIYIYDKGTETQPGPLIANDTTYTLDTTGITTVHLVTPVHLSGHDELWIAVEWTQEPFKQYPGGYALMDQGPAVLGKGDWIYLNNVWYETQSTLDRNWGIGAIIEGQGVTQLAIGNIKGPLGIIADLQNTGPDYATDVHWSIIVTGGLFKRINVTAIGTTPLLFAGAYIPIFTRVFFGFGKISILITAKAQNAAEVIAIKSAFVLGPFVLG